MNLARLLTAAFVLLALAAPAWAQTGLSDLQLRVGMCDASAAVALGSERFIVANDEDSFLRVYQRGASNMPLQAFDLHDWLMVNRDKPETDIEGATAIGNRIYWITSHGRNKNAEFRESRFRFWANDWRFEGNKVALDFIGVPYTRLQSDLLSDSRLARYDLQSASQKAPKAEGGFNIESLAATPQGSILIGFRNPIPGGKAIVITLENPAEVVQGSGAPRFGPIAELDLGGLGVRGMEYAPAIQRYLLIAGEYNTGRPSQLYSWSGVSGQPAEKIPNVDFGKLNPESIIVYPDWQRRIQIVCDEGTKLIGGRECKTMEDTRQRSFQTAIVDF